MTRLPFADLARPGASRRSLVVVAPGATDDQWATDGSGPWVADLVRALADGTEPWRVIVTKVGAQGSDQIANGVVVRTLAPHGLALPSEMRMQGGLSWDLPTILEDGDVIIVDQCLTRAGEVACLAAKAFGRPTVAVADGGAPNRVGVSLGLLGLVDAVVCHSELMALALPPSTPHTVILPGVDHTWFSPPLGSNERRYLSIVVDRPDDALVQHLVDGLTEQVPIVIACANLDLLSAQMLQELCGEQSVSIRTIGDVGTRRDLYRESMMVLELPSDSGQDVSAPPSGNAHRTTLEAMACGAPVVIDSSNPNREFVDDGVSGLVVDGFDQLLEAVRALVDDPARREELAGRGRDAIVSRFTLDGAVARLDALLERLRLSDRSTAT